MTTYLAFNELPIEKLEDGWTLSVEEVSVRDFLEDENVPIPIVSARTAPLYEVFEAFYGDLDIEMVHMDGTNKFKNFNHLDRIYVVQFAGLVSGKHHYSSEEIGNCDDPSDSFKRFTVFHGTKIFTNIAYE
ncbi:hypothetical protein [Okeania sp. SIO2B3]|uniref:hypothetical protein n=1 Tax=Okeania sp. SIO2B3 TaxID=2607784 RepID=UPI0013C29AA3|nr:hypothetical protein [Okeania sp. SIO2B3]NET44860.1 hypothetical protein [Okeania sp. SIO2B3]